MRSGHGGAVHAELPDGRWDAAHRIRTEVMPRAEVLRMEPPDIEDLTIDMQVLAETEMGGFAPLLTPLVDDYEDWIAEKSAYFADEPQELKEYRNETAVVQAEWVVRAGTHQSRNNALLDVDADAARAFKFANRAMWLQRIRIHLQ